MVSLVLRWNDEIGWLRSIYIMKCTYWYSGHLPTFVNTYQKDMDIPQNQDSLKLNPRVSCYKSSISERFLGAPHLETQPHSVWQRVPKNENHLDT